ncbi:MAG: hypothetical protein COS85_08930 [Armatimonadetes bacterium CG07_land_8_20_14_0_80_59_28]|nr:MAG: hypothetical protein COS85_08930 [Armatimonadetes bacterium CG07_land_8_20_14_0_80_59_28]
MASGQAPSAFSGGKRALRTAAGFVTLIVLAGAPQASAARLALVQQVAGEARSAYSIYADTAAPSPIKLAAEEIQRALAISTGIKLPIAEAPCVPMICLGDNAVARKAGLSAEKLPDEGFRIVTKGKNLYILGKDSEDNYPWRGWESRGTLFGAYEFLERIVGVRWLMPGEVGEEIPALKSLSVPNLNVVQSPDFMIRELMDIQNQVRSPHPKDPGTQNVDRWLLRHKNPNVSDAFKSSRSKILWGHAWDQLVTRKDLEEHPEWQAVSGGRGKFCTSNPEVVKHFAQGVIRWLDENSDRRSVSITPEDGGDFCKCDTCKAGTEQDWHGNLSYTPVILKFYNDVGRIVAQKHPGRIVGGLVYYNYMYPPKAPIEMERNVWLWLAPLNYYGWGLAKPIYQEELPRLISGWTAVTPNFLYLNFSVWFRSLNGTPLPPGLPLLKLEIPTAHRTGAKGVGMVGIGAWGYGGCENYILAKLLWDAESDVDALYREWMQKTYGPAWKTMDQFVMMIEDRVLARKHEENPRYSGDNYEVNYDFVEQVCKPIFSEMERLYLQAMSEVKTDKQSQRLAMLGDNLVMLHYNLRKADMLAEPEKSTFFRTDEQYVQFLAATEFALSMYRDHGHRDVPLLFHGSFSDEGENPPMEVRKAVVHRIPKATPAPVIDGDLSDAVWGGANTTGEFRRVGGKAPVERQTKAQLLYDNNNIYFSFACQVQAPKNYPKAVTERDGNVFADECIEVLLATFPQREAEVLAPGSRRGEWSMGRRRQDTAREPRMDQRYTCNRRRMDRGDVHSPQGYWYRLTARGEDRQGKSLPYRIPSRRRRCPQFVERRLPRVPGTV